MTPQKNNNLTKIILIIVGILVVIILGILLLFFRKRTNYKKVTKIEGSSQIIDIRPSEILPSLNKHISDDNIVPCIPVLSISDESDMSINHNPIDRTVDTITEGNENSRVANKTDVNNINNNSNNFSQELPPTYNDVVNEIITERNQYLYSNSSSLGAQQNNLMPSVKSLNYFK